MAIDKRITKTYNTHIKGKGALERFSLAPLPLF